MNTDVVPAIHHKPTGAWLRHRTWPAVAMALATACCGQAVAQSDDPSSLLLIGIGDSLTHGTMDATNNATNTTHAYLQVAADLLAQSGGVRFVQPLLDDTGHRIDPGAVPTNLGVDGADLFSAMGIEYYLRVGAERSYLDLGYVCEVLRPGQLEDKYDKVLYPLNLLSHRPATQISGVEELLGRNTQPGQGSSAVVFWLGNNDSSLAALGSGGANPSFLPLPFPQIAPYLDPALRVVLSAAEQQGAVSFAPYTAAAIDRNMTTEADFVAQLGLMLDRIGQAPEGAGKEVFVLTLPYYSAVAYLLDAEDLEFYLRKLDPQYSVPASFKRVEEGLPLTGDRVSLLTFGMMYALLATGAGSDVVNSVLEVDGVQADGLVMSEAESQRIRERIDAYNAAIVAAVEARGAPYHLVDLGGYINRIFTGDEVVTVGGVPLKRNWSRGGAFSLDGVHPGYTAQALLANQLLAAMDTVLGRSTPLADLETIATTDPYRDNDGDGWVSGPDSPASGIAELLFLFTDPDDANPNTQVQLPADVWHLISRVLLAELIGVPQVRSGAEQAGLLAPELLRRH